MFDRTSSFSELISKHLIEIGAGRPRTVNMNGRDFPILRVADVLNGRIEYELQTYASCEDMKGEMSKVSRPGDIVLTVKGTVGRVALMPPDGPVFAYSPQLCFFRPSAAGPLRSRFLYYWFNSAEFWTQANALKAQTDMADFLSLGDIQQMRITIPPLDRQDAVVGILGALDDKISVNDRIVATANKLARELVRAELSGAQVPLRSIAEVTMGSSPPGESYNESGVGVPFYQGVRDFGIRFPARRVWTEMPVRMARKSDTLLSVRAPVGSTNLAEEPVCIGRGLAALRSRSGRPMSLFHQIGLANAAWEPFQAEGTIFGAITKNQLEAARIPEVAQPSAARLEEQVSSIEARITAGLAEASFLSSVRDELLPSLLSGKVRVRDAEKRVERVV